MNANVGLLINSSRGIIYASSGTDFAEARAEALKMQQEMERILSKVSNLNFKRVTNLCFIGY
jgi:orotidine-5'-phosphate decarboxylase